MLLTSSVHSEGDHVSVCPNTNITFTCSDTQTFTLVWYAQPLLNEGNTPGISIRRNPGHTVVVDEMFTITVKSVENITEGLGDIISTLSMVVNERIQNRTNVTCLTNSGTKYLIILLRAGAI